MTKNTDETILEPFQSILRFSGNKEFKNYGADVKRKWIQMRKVNGETKGHSQESPFCGCEKTMQYALMRSPRLNSAEP